MSKVLDIVKKILAMAVYVVAITEILEFAKTKFEAILNKPTK